MAVEAIRDELKVETTIPTSEYGKLANYLIAVRGVLEQPTTIDECKNIMLENLQKSKQKDSKTLDRLKIHDSFGFWEEHQTAEYNNFMEEMTAAFQGGTFAISVDDTPLEYIKKITDLMCDNDSPIRQNKSFMDKIDVDINALYSLKGAINRTSKDLIDIGKGNRTDIVSNVTYTSVSLLASNDSISATSKVVFE